jgi:hypothetical protein
VRFGDGAIDSGHAALAILCHLPMNVLDDHPPHHWSALLVLPLLTCASRDHVDWRTRRSRFTKFPPPHRTPGTHAHTHTR